MITRVRWLSRGGMAALAATIVLSCPTLGYGQVNRGGGGGFGGGGGGGFGSQQGGVGQRALMVNPNSPGGDRMYQYSSATGSGILQGPLIIQSQFGGAGGIGGQNYGGGGGTYGGAGFGGGGGF